LPSQDDWKMGLFLYYSLIKPMEEYVEKCENNRQRANVNIHEYSNFPDRSFNPTEYQAQIIEAHELKDEDTHVGVLIYKIGSDDATLFDQSKDGMTMSMTCKRQNIRTFTYHDITYFYGCKLQEVMPENWNHLEGTEYLHLESYDDFDNWLFYRRNKALKRDGALYQIIGWNQNEFCTFITMEKELLEQRKQQSI